MRRSIISHRHHHDNLLGRSLFLLMVVVATITSSTDVLPVVHGFSTPAAFCSATFTQQRRAHKFLVTTRLEARRKKPDTNIGRTQDNDNGEDGEVGSGPNWIERSFPVDVPSQDGGGGSSELKKVEDYNLGISGVSFQTGSLSKRMFDVMMSKSRFASNPDDDIQRAFTLYAMDFTAKEATKAALKQNGLDIALQEEEQDEGMWGDLDSIRLLDLRTNDPLPGVYSSTEEAIDEGGWVPGQGFDFVVRQVPAKIKELSLEELLQALDPDGSLREEAKQANMTLPTDKDFDGELDYADINSLQELANDAVRRTEQAPRGATAEDEAFLGDIEKRGYRPILQRDLAARNEDGSEKHQTTMHVMDAMVSHGALVVDLSNEGTDFDIPQKMATMWKGIEEFFENINQSDEAASHLSPMQTIMEAGSQSAKVGYAAWDNNSMQFLETRKDRTTGELLPTDAQSLLGDDTVAALQDVFSAVTSIGKDAVRIAVSASSVEYGAYPDDGVEASKAAALMTEELLDDGSTVASTSKFPVCMSPHRLCRYTNNQQEGESDPGSSSSSREVFGAHTDSTWMTIVPVAAVSGLEVYDEAEEKWYRPELAARKHWQKEQFVNGKDPNAFYEEVAGGGSIPWHARYVTLMPGELLQVATRNEVSAAVHRVVATQRGPSRLSAPILLRCRAGVKMDVSRYLGGSRGDPLLEECDGMTIEQIHDALQPTSFQ